MKKQSFAIAIILSILLNTVAFAFKSYAEEDTEEEITVNQVETLYKTSNYATHYFYNLTENFGYNLASSCGYVGVGMLLAFYDIYWDSSIVADLYNENAYLEQSIITSYPTLNSNSPGIRSDYEIHNLLDSLVETGENNQKNYTDYYNYVLDHSSDYFHFELINIGMNQRLSLLESSNLSLSQDQIYYLMEHYLKFFTAYNLLPNISINSINNTSNAQVIQDIAECIDSGKPVLLSGCSDAGDAHAMIAYDYSTDSNGNIELYVHMGYTSEPELTHVALSSTRFTTYLEAIYLDVQTEHFCGESYVREDGTVFCSCALAIHPEHTHSFTYRPYSSSQHKRWCIKCGTASYVAHIIRVGTNTCLYCGATVGGDGPVVGTGVNGYGTYLLTHDVLPYIVEYITNDGSYVLSNGVVVLSEYDYQLWKSGMLNIEENAEI